MLSSRYPPSVSKDEVDISFRKGTVERTVRVGWRNLGGVYMLVHGQWSFHGHEDGSWSRSQFLVQRSKWKALYISHPRNDPQCAVWQWFVSVGREKSQAKSRREGSRPGSRCLTGHLGDSSPEHWLLDDSSLLRPNPFPRSGQVTALLSPPSAPPHST